MIIRNRKGGIALSATGYIQARAYTSYAQIPLQGAAITITASDGTAIAMGLTDRNGKLAPVALPVPDLSASQTPDSGQVPFATVDLHAQLQGYEQITVRKIQVFANTITDQNLEMIPLSELPNQWNQSEFFDTPSQNL